MVVVAVGILYLESLIYRNLISLHPFYERPGVCMGLEVRCSYESPSETVRTEAGISGALNPHFMFSGIVQVCV